MRSLGFLLHTTATLLKREFERAARPHQLTLLQWRVLGELSRDDRLSQLTLGGHLDASPMSISDVVDRLDVAGLVTRDVDPADGRAKLVGVTGKARLLVERMRVVADDVYAWALDGVDKKD